MKSIAIATAAALLSLSSPAQALTLFPDNGTAAEITSTVDAFRAALGDANPNEPVNFPDGRRQIDWDAAPDFISDPNPFPGDFFNFTASPRARGIEFSTPGTGFLLSANPGTGTPPLFDGAGIGLGAFSTERIFTPVGSNIVDVDFFDPADTDAPALTRGLGVVFVDVELAGSASMEFFDAAGGSLGAFDVPDGDDGSFSFLGVDFGANVVGSVRIISGTTVFGTPEFFDGPGDSVVMDDFIFGEPTPRSAEIPLPAAAWMMLAGLGALGAVRGRRRRAERV
ncbi:MAG: VPLPA-CTERM sorting domain-containing protein [Pseudomonadota bacterium]